MGNIVSGYELITRLDSRHRREVFGILLPLVTSESGDKFGKSAGAPVWLSKEKTSPFDFFQVNESLAVLALPFFVYHLNLA